MRACAMLMPAASQAAIIWAVAGEREEGAGVSAASGCGAAQEGRAAPRATVARVLLSQPVLQVVGARESARLYTHRLPVTSRERARKAGCARDLLSSAPQKRPRPQTRPQARRRPPWPQQLSPARAREWGRVRRVGTTRWEPPPRPPRLGQRAAHTALAVRPQYEAYQPRAGAGSLREARTRAGKPHHDTVVPHLDARRAPPPAA